MRRDEARPLPGDFDYHGISGLSAELRQKLADIQPATMGQAARIDGMTPAALTLVLAVSRRRAKRRHAEHPMEPDTGQSMMPHAERPRNRRTDRRGA
jgi:hypothetical protein